MESTGEKNKLKMLKTSFKEHIEYGRVKQAPCWWDDHLNRSLMDLENMISTLRRCTETRTQTSSHFGRSGCQTREYLEGLAQQKIPALNGKRNSITREPSREQTPVSFSILGRYFSFLPQSFRLSCCALLRHTSCRTQHKINNVDWMLQSITSVSPLLLFQLRRTSITTQREIHQFSWHLNCLCNKSLVIQLFQKSVNILKRETFELWSKRNWNLTGLSSFYRDFKLFSMLI